MSMQTLGLWMTLNNPAIGLPEINMYEATQSDNQNSKGCVNLNTTKTLKHLAEPPDQQVSYRVHTVPTDKKLKKDC